MLAMDWQGVLSGQPLQWIISGFLTTLWVTLAGVVLATLIAICPLRRADARITAPPFGEIQMAHRSSFIRRR